MLNRLQELYEPLWNEILQRAERNNFQIRSIWIAEAASMGMSAIFNEDKLSIDCKFHDIPRQLWSWDLTPFFGLLI